ncbi:hypothetical protein [Arsenicibacter rosenii]|uniref:HYR domain-containing protein n=1 Tax=Arsenicibacter rosenii TaxID=1750698 RepID=A0A1S2VD04_9BACT|nr:hypothetical protein [Arsenicibacter rosenii]OIN56300.1 hypothetical protein BLX24_25665 [Arsenicibacter rosenii]
MKQLITILGILGLTGAAAFGQQPLDITCPQSATTTFNSVNSGDIPSDFVPPATNCQRIFTLTNAIAGGGSGNYAYTTSFAGGSPAPAFLPTSTTGNSGQYFAFAPGQTVVTVTVTDKNTQVTKACSFTVQVNDDAAPVINSQTPQQFAAKATTTMPDLRNQVMVDEDCNYTVSQFPAPGSPVSGTSVSLTFVATDAYANASAPYAATLVFPGSTPLDGIQISATGGCATDGKITVSLTELPDPQSVSIGMLTLSYTIDNGPIQTEPILLSNPTATFQTNGGLTAGTHTISFIGVSPDLTTVFLLNQSASVYIGTPTPSISNLISVNPGNTGICGTTIQGQAVGNSFIFRGPNGYVFSNVFRNAGTFNVFANTLKEPGQYTLTVTFPANNCGTATTATQTITINGTKCE